MILILGDCLEKIAALDERSIDSVVCDPPYGINFMGKSWDGKAIADAAAKPWNSEGHMRLSGSPDSKSRKLIHRTGSAYRNRAGEAGAYDFSLKGNHAFQDWCSQWGEQLLRVLKPGGHALVFGGPRTYHRLAAGLEDAGFEIRDCLMWLYGSGFPKSKNLPGGIGSALKPAWEPIVLCRKPLEGTTEQTVTRYGTGGLNIDATRIGLQGDYKSKPNGRPSLTGLGDNYDSAQANQPDDLGRWPANLLLSHHPDCVQTGTTIAPGRNMNRYTDGVKPFGGGVGHPHESEQMPDEEVEVWDCVDDCPVRAIGAESRFFYVPKVSASERSAGLDDFERQQTQPYNERPSGGLNAHLHGADPPPRANIHPTVKPLTLMRYLCRLITPNGGTVLDCFMGSGSTAIAAHLEGFDFIGIEREENYMEIARARLEFWQKWGEAGLKIVAERDARLRVARVERERLEAMGQLELL